MFYPIHAFYLSKEKRNGYVGYLTSDSCYLILDINEGINYEQGQQIIDIWKKNLSESSLQNLADLDAFLSKNIQGSNLPTDFSLAAVFFKDNIAYLKTYGRSVIFLKRGRDLHKLIENGRSASGYLQKDDIFVLTTQDWLDTVGEEENLKTYLTGSDPHLMVDLIKGKNQSVQEGLPALILCLKEKTYALPVQEAVPELPQPQKVKPWSKLTQMVGERYQQLRSRSELGGKKKIVTLIGVVVIIGILIWSVGGGLQRRVDNQNRNKIRASQTVINQKLDQADEEAFLDLPKALALITEARSELDKLKKEIDSRKYPEIAALEKTISDEENKITKKEEKKYEEFYDLTLDNKQAKGEKLALSGDNLLILDNQKGIIYSLSLAKKSLDKVQSSEIVDASLIDQYDGDIFFFVSGKGIYKSSAGKNKLVIENDKDWGNITDMKIYNGNIYLLDTGKNQIDKYLVAENGYSAKTPYFKSTVNLDGANSLAIDSSVYIGFDSLAVKYTAGSAEDFKTSFPDSNAAMAKIFTNKDVEKVYGWDKAKGAIYIMDKNGTYEKQVESSIFKKVRQY